MKILVVDDEALISHYIVQCIRDASDTAEIVGVASSGQKALEILKKEPVDLVFTDITMPKMDGLELCRHIWTQYPTVNVVMLTCHDDFSYARKAMQYNARDYILKTELSADVLRPILERMNKDKKQRTTGASKQSMDRNKYLRRIIEDEAGSILPNVRKLRENHIYLEERPYLALLFRNLDENISVIQEYLSKGFENPTYYVYEEKELLLLVNLPRSGTCQTTDEVNAYFQSCQAQLSGLLGNSGIYSSLAQLHDAISAAFADVDAKFYGHPLKPKSPDNDITQIAQYIMRAVIKISDGDTNGGCSEIVRLLEYAEKNNPRFSFLRDSIIQLFSGLQAKTGIVLDNLARISDCRSFAALKVYVQAQIDRLSVEGHLYSAPIRKALDYINFHYADDISLNMVADFVYLNRDYLSRQFKKEVGVNFSEYLTSLRMKKAHQLLETTHLRVSDIALGVGITNISYFSTLFHKTYGYTPNDVRRENLKE